VSLPSYLTGNDEFQKLGHNSLCLVLSCQFVVNLIGCVRRSDVFEDLNKIISQGSMFTSFSVRINHRETAECYGATGKALEFKIRGFMLW
jgi:hypothetical protein